MCMGSKSSAPPPDNSAAIAREEEAKRQARITQGQSSIDSSFAGYDDNFYHNYQNDYSNYYTPQLDDQYDKARKRLTLDLAKTGNLTSSAGATQMGDLKGAYDHRMTGIQGEAMDAVNNLRGNVDNAKSSLYADNRNAADPGNAASMAAARATSLRPGTPTSPLADTFADFFNNVGNAAGASGGFGKASPNQTGVQNYNAGGGNGSYKVYQ